MKSLAAKFTWQRVLALSASILIVGRLIANWKFPGSVASEQLFWLAAIAVELKLLVEISPFIRRFLQSRRNGDSFSKQLSSLLPLKVIALFHLELAQQRGFIAWIRRQSAVDKVNGEIFEHYQKSQYPTIFLIVILLCLTDVPISTFTLSIAVNDPILSQRIHWFMLFIIAYTFVWLFSDRHLVKTSHHVVGPDILNLCVGARFSATIPLAALKDVFPIKHKKELSDSRSIWLRKNGFDRPSTVIGTPIDQPNVALILDKTVPVDIEKFKIKLHDIQYLLVYVDEPQRFVQAIRVQLDNRTKAG